MSGRKTEWRIFSQCGRIQRSVLAGYQKSGCGWHDRQTGSDCHDFRSHCLLWKQWCACLQICSTTWHFSRFHITECLMRQRSIFISLQQKKGRCRWNFAVRNPCDRCLSLLDQRLQSSIGRAKSSDDSLIFLIFPLASRQKNVKRHALLDANWAGSIRTEVSCTLRRAA